MKPMKTKFTILMLLIASICYSQSKGINYKALIKDGNNNILTFQNITVVFTIYQGPALTNDVYQEEHQAMTDGNGIIIVNIGEGYSPMGGYNTINWAADDHFLKVQIDSGTGLTTIGTTEFKAVPYALHAANISGLEEIDEGNGIGWRLVGSDPANFGNIGLDAVDLSVNTDEPSTTSGATGRASFAAGEFSEASGIGSTAIGGGIASGNRSIAIGNGSNATVDETLAIGGGTASGNQAVAIGSNTTASGTSATALGLSTTASGWWSTSMGLYSIASGNYATAIGHSTTAQGYNSFASGINTLASGVESTAMGTNSIASGHKAVSIGVFTKAEAYNVTAIGSFNVGGGGFPNTWHETDPLFEIGNGTSDVARTNALTIFKNGNATLAGTLTQNSDKRLKTNIGAIPYGLNTILQLNPVSYNWIKQPEQTQQSLGLIAQEVEPLIKEIVKVGIDKDQTLSLSYIELIPVLIKAMQEQQDIIKNQDTKINSLTAELEQLKTLDQRVKQLEALTNGQQ